MVIQSTTQRHRTAIRRTALSRPLRLGIEAGLISKEYSLFDYGCGRGDDLRGLQAYGIQCRGWDPVYRSDVNRQESDIVNLGYVINVIEDVEEREQTLIDAWKLAKRVLIVSARLSVEAKRLSHEPYNDGYLTQRGTFQKFFTQQELRDWIDETLGVICVPAAPGIFFVFRDETARQSYRAARYRRSVTAPIPRQSHNLFDQHRGLLQPLIDFFSSRGRLPSEYELPNAIALCDVFGSLRRAFGVIERASDKARWVTLREERSQDLLIYLALERFVGRPHFSALPRDLQLDTKAFFGSYTRACSAADNLLFSVGNMNIVNTACKESAHGKLTPEALYVHASTLPFLSPTLRVYEGCARTYIGLVEEANVIKLNRLKPQISYLSYPDFDQDPHPALVGSLVVNLQTFHVSYRDYSDSASPPILHRKEQFVTSSYPFRDKFERLTRQEENKGLYESPSQIGTRNKWLELLSEKGLRLAGHRLVRDVKSNFDHDS